MLYCIIGFLLGILLFILNIVLKIAVKTLTLTLDKLMKALGAEQVSSTAKQVGKTAEKTVRIGIETVKAGIRTAKLGLRVAILALKALIALIKLILALMKVLVALITCTAFWVVILIIFLVVILIVIAVSVSSMGNMAGEKTSGYSSKMGMSSHNYMDIDWSQDFSDKLDLIESTYGKVDRDWAELVVISMNTQQNKADIDVPVQGYTIGIVAIESGGGDFMANPDSHPMSGYCLRNTSEGLQHELGGNPTSADGVFQITNAGWTKWNPLYDGLQGSMSPLMNADTPWFTQRYYIPSGVYGQLSRYSQAINSSSYGFSRDEMTSVERAFNILGIEATEGKLDFVKNACLASYAYGGLVDGCCGSREGAKSDLATNIAMFVTMYCETYMYYNNASDTYEYSQLSTKLSQSIISTLGTPYAIGINNSSVVTSVYGKTGVSTFSEEMLAEVSKGVLDADGMPINQTIDGYLYSIMPDTAKEFFDSTCSDTMDIMSNTGWYARGYYDISMLIASNYILEKTIGLMGLKTAELDGEWMHAVDEMGQWYASNVDSYCQMTGLTSWTDPSTALGRGWYYCDLIGGTVGDDCSSFLTAVCGYYGVIPDYKGGWAYRGLYFRESEGQPIVSQLMDAGFAYYTATSDYVPQAGDIRISDGHIEIVAGIVEVAESGTPRQTVFAYTWGKNCGVSNPNGGEPQKKYGVSSYVNDTLYYWRLQQ